MTTDTAALKNTQAPPACWEMASKFSIGRHNFERRFKKATNNTPVEAGKI